MTTTATTTTTLSPLGGALRGSPQRHAPRSFASNGTFAFDAVPDDADELDQHLVREAVMSIDDQYVVCCDSEGSIAAGSTIVDLLFDRHGTSSGRLTDSLLGGQQVRGGGFLIKIDHSSLRPVSQRHIRHDTV